VLKDLYQEELTNLRELAVDFSRDNPVLAPMLAARGDDPDVERLLEGTAFLSAMIRQRLAEGFPDLIQSLLRIVFPQVLLPTPSCTMVQFKPVQGFVEPLDVPRGVELASVPVEGAAARFVTASPLTVWPAVVQRAALEQGAGQAILRLQVASAAPLSRWLPSSLVFHCAGDYPEASERRRLVLQHVVAVEAEVGGLTVGLPRQALEPAGLDEGERLVPTQLLEGFSLLQEYFVMPQKFLFFRVGGLKALAGFGDSAFTLKLTLAGLKAAPPPVRPEHFLLNVCPAVNVFPHSAHPVTLDHRRHEYLLRPQDHETEKLDVFSVVSVNSVSADGRSKPYAPFEGLSGRRAGQGLYSLMRRASAITGQPEHFLNVVYERGGEAPKKETLSVSLLCHNVGLTERLRTGEVNQPTDTSPVMAAFANIIPPTRHSRPVEGDDQLWQLLSHLNVNLMPALSGRTLGEILALHAVPNDADASRALSNAKRIAALDRAETSMEDGFVKGLLMRGCRISLTVDQSGFASLGDLLLFGDVLDRFFGLYHHVNVYSRLSMTEKNTQEVFSWRPRLGLKRLI
jgi:type VI secretion system protein ImpG